MHRAPLSDGKSGSSYPHWFTNGYNGDGKLKKGRKGPEIKFPNKKCNFRPRHTTGTHMDDRYLLEFPVFPDGRLYPHEKKPKEKPGPARVIYTWPNKDFCGVVAHTERDSTGPLQLCRK